MRQFFLKLLFRLADPSLEYSDIDRTLVDKWLLEQYKDPGFREFIRLREYEILKSFAHPQNREDYLMLLGQRLEYLRLLGRVSDVHKKEVKRQEKRKAKLEAEAKQA